jgi:hypothetical protein
MENQVQASKTAFIKDHCGAKRVNFDLETIQQTVLAGKAMLASYKGKQGATIDYIIHLLRIPELVEEKYDTDLSPDFKKLVEGYCVCGGLITPLSKASSYPLLPNIL